ncbi:MAG: hypothetical protein DMF84_16385 [Acidobacteria bacterium]|nr:MAG: hypothetical protein DMF84_16385 [Acidobacteriota bacterium]
MERDLSYFRPSKVWRRMPLEQRIVAAALFWADEQSADQQLEAVGSIATQMKFRPRSVLSLADDRKARYLAGLPNVSDSVAARALVSYHLALQRPMMGAFLDLLGISHENGLIAEDTMSKPDPSKLKQAAADLAAKYPAADVAVYLATLVSQDPETWDGLVELPEAQPA